MGEENLAGQLELLLRNHDWYYDYSDDHRSWTKGKRERDEINALVKKMPEAEARAVWDQCVSGTFPFPGSVYKPKIDEQKSA